MYCSIILNITYIYIHIIFVCIHIFWYCRWSGIKEMWTNRNGGFKQTTKDSSNNHSRWPKKMRTWTKSFKARRFQDFDPWIMEHHGPTSATIPIDLVFWILTSPWGSKKEERDVWVAVRGHRYQGPEMSSTGPLLPSHPCWGDLVKLPSLAGTVAILSSFLFSTERKSMTPLVVNQ